MDNRSLMKPLKIVALIIVDLITLLLFFSIWAIFNLSLFPWALLGVFAPLILINLWIMGSEKLLPSFGVANYASILIATLAYYFAMLVFTGFNYLFITVRGYLIWHLIITLAYVSVVIGLYLSGVQKRNDMESQAHEKDQVLNMKLQVMQMQNQLALLQSSLNRLDFQRIESAFLQMQERLNASTPFGRNTQSIMVQQEQLISNQMGQVESMMKQLSSLDAGTHTVEEVVQSLEGLRNAIVNREKLMIQ